MMSAYDVLMGIYANQPDGTKIAHGCSENFQDFFYRHRKLGLLKSVPFFDEGTPPISYDVEDAMYNLKIAGIIHFDFQGCRYLFSLRKSRDIYEKEIAPRLQESEKGELEKLATEFTTEFEVE